LGVAEYKQQPFAFLVVRVFRPNRRLYLEEDELAD